MYSKLMILVSPLIGILVSKFSIIMFFLYQTDAPLSEVFSLFRALFWYTLLLYFLFLIISIPTYLFIKKIFRMNYLSCQIIALVPFVTLGVVLTVFIKDTSLIELESVDYFYLTLSLLAGSIISGIVYMIGNQRTKRTKGSGLTTDSRI